MDASTQQPATSVGPRVLGVASILAGAALNPWFVARLLYGAAAGGPRAMHAALWGFEAALFGIGALLLTRRLRLPSVLRGLLMAAFTTVVAVALVVIGDRMWGRFGPKRPEGLIFPPGSAVTYRTKEFDVTVRVNNLGFRGEDCAVAKGGRRRVLAIGDSFTLGWGVDVADAWTTLVARGSKDLEVLNLGQGGAYPRMYAETARKAIPMLSPDLVVVAVLQGDDLFQTIEWLDRGKKPRQERVDPPSALESASSFVRARVLRNLLGSEGALVTSVGDTWRPQAKSLRGYWSAEQRARFDGLDAEVRAAFDDGTLNPITVHHGIANPDYYARHADPASPDARRGIESIAESLKEIARVAREHRADVIVVSVPYRAYVCRRDLASLRRLGYEAPDALAASDGPDRAIAEAAERAGVPFRTITPAVRAACAERDLYYPLDGHFTPAGNALFASLVADAIR
jgi:hypothetical protein